MSAPTAPPRSGLAGRLLAAIALVMAAGAVTAWAVASLVGPAVFHEHMLRAGLSDHDEAVLHAEEAFRSASSLALGFALAAAAAASLAVSLVLTRRIGRSLAVLSSAASSLGGGRYDSRVPPPQMGREFDDLADAFNSMAARLQEGERLRGRLLADVAHEIRTPVATLTAYLEAIEDGVQDLGAETVALLRDQASRLTRLSDDLTAVTRAESGDLALDREHVAPGDLVAAAVAASRERAAERGVDLREDSSASLPEVLVDRLRLAQVLDNLVTNALRHTPPGGTVTVGAASAGRDVTLTVRDTGEGIAAEDLPHVFERFYRADTARDRAHGGSGIGLAICLALVHAHGGTLSAASPGPGAGSTFTVTLPTG
ncbi:integral membrane sensor signal transduction histidine kinase [Cellulomonas flavigena DSM 20109]|uniref:histidine kinase n=1 Tax=Cellulomonas flavigena (strain ATCC 482 / DSM 20109 / BCRC 11376 / JCM 18109 / NBRC 3775 / NCIMB 8073 / NRS 134) TaxID=446466 RepID=D5UDF2_CELFN|nr:ATP-binding protein [Cellulomonas flavigena]ADG76408.1 integral membrane sensor signal transduction histidine kinase [Cellulomonas flavigena DSM 20109]